MEPGVFSGLKSAGGIRSLLLSAYMASASPSCRRLFVQLTRKARFLALLNAGNNMPARIAMMAMTTSSSIKVKAEFRFIDFRFAWPNARRSLSARIAINRDHDQEL